MITVPACQLFLPQARGAGSCRSLTLCKVCCVDDVLVTNTSIAAQHHLDTSIAAMCTPQMKTTIVRTFQAGGQNSWHPIQLGSCCQGQGVFLELGHLVVTHQLEQASLQGQPRGSRGVNTSLREQLTLPGWQHQQLAHRMHWRTGNDCTLLQMSATVQGTSRGSREC